MKITVEVDDFWMDSDSDSLDYELKKFVINESVRTIHEKFKEEFKSQIDEIIKERIRDLLTKKLETTISEIVGSEMVTNPEYSPYSSSNKDQPKEISLKDYAKWYFLNKTSNNHGSKFDALVRDQGKKLSEEMKGRYDLLFASQIVSKMNGQGLLKDDVAKLLLPEVKES